MKKVTTIIFILAIMISCSEEKSILTVSSGKIIRLENFKSAYVDARNVDIWLPETYSHKQKYGVLYMHDGQMLYDTTITWNHQEWGVDEVVSKLIEEKTIDPIIVVGIWNNGKKRYPEYFPQKPFEMVPGIVGEENIEEFRKKYGQFLSMQIESDNYLKFIVKELKTYIDRNFSTKTEKENTFVAGSSMGGLISMYAICEYPEVFSGAACISTHWPGVTEIENNPVPQAFFNYLKNNLPDPSTHKIYFDYGTETLDALYEPYQIVVDSIMKEKGFSEKNWMTQKYEGHDHSEISWNKRLDVPAKFLLKK